MKKIRYYDSNSCKESDEKLVGRAGGCRIPPQNKRKASVHASKDPKREKLRSCSCQKDERGKSVTETVNRLGGKKIISQILIDFPNAKNLTTRYNLSPTKRK
eukprot:TRINITY_DN23934_c0_g1_i2.p1 TRINITY_DN23934_c0_g1~~TRINITY_DN23934_c0_g1_i2.p1  ORF type:complete len:102 (-),score=7.45 TRINITY_DN23934_c0_g1_i2:193-498(-)